MLSQTTSNLATQAAVFRKMNAVRATTIEANSRTLQLDVGDQCANWVDYNLLQLNIQVHAGCVIVKGNTGATAGLPKLPYALQFSAGPLVPELRLKVSDVLILCRRQLHNI